MTENKSCWCCKAEGECSIRERIVIAHLQHEGTWESMWSGNTATWRLAGVAVYCAPLSVWPYFKGKSDLVQLTYEVLISSGAGDGHCPFTLPLRVSSGRESELAAQLPTSAFSFFSQAWTCKIPLSHFLWYICNKISPPPPVSEQQGKPCYRNSLLVTFLPTQTNQLCTCPSLQFKASLSVRLRVWNSRLDTKS